MSAALDTFLAVPFVGRQPDGRARPRRPGDYDPADDKPTPARKPLDLTRGRR